MKVNLTHSVVQALAAPAGGRADFWDSKTPSFGIRVSSRGTKTWIMMYRQNRRKRRLVLGRWPGMSLAEARAEARRKLGDVANGHDPAQDRADAKRESTFGELAALYLERHASVNKKPKSAAEDRKMLDADLIPAWGDLKISQIGRKDVIAVLDGIVARGAAIQANRVRALICKMFNFAIGRGLVEHSPAYQVPRPAPERQRDRVLTEDEIRRLWVALDTEPVKVMAAIKLVLLTAARRSEVLGMRWSELDLGGGWWTVAAERSKNGLAHRVPLTPTALEILRVLKAEGRDLEFVFPGGRRGRAVENPQKWMARIRERAALPDFRMHDLRRTGASLMTALGITRLVVSKLLNHVENGVTAVYDRHSYDTEKRAALLRWERRLMQIVERAPAVESRVAVLRSA